MIRCNTNENSRTFDYPKVSVIVATYKRTETLEKALISLVNQDYTNYEIIVVDDNAEKKWNCEVSKIVNDIKEKYEVELTYIQNHENLGSARTRNKGIEVAKGDYITFLDDDDIYLTSKVRNQIQHMLETNADFSVTDIWLYDDKDNLIEKRERKIPPNLSNESLMKYHILHHITAPDSMMFKKDYLIKIGMFTSIDVGDDYYLIEKSIKGLGKFSYLHECDIKAYVHTDGSGLSSGTSKIRGEKLLYEHKKKSFNFLNKNEIKYIKMRHYAVIAYAEFREREFLKFIKNALQSFVQSPKGFVSLLNEQLVVKNISRRIL